MVDSGFTSIIELHWGGVFLGCHQPPFTEWLYKLELTR